MKKLFLLIFLALSFAGMSQSGYIVAVSSDKNNAQKEQSSDPKLGVDELYAEYEAMSNQLAKTNYYLDKYARQSLTGEVMIIAGSMMLGMAPYINEDTAVLFTLLGTGIGVAGYVVKLTAYNNIKSSRIKYDGFKVTYKL